MRRNIVLPIVGGVVAALVLVGAILLIGKNHDKTKLTISTPIPSATVEASQSPTPSASPSGSPTASPTGSPAATARASATPVVTAKPTPAPTPYRAVSNVNCSSASDAKYCTRDDGMVVASGKATKSPENKGSTTVPDGPTYTMVSTYDESKHNLHVEVTVENKSKKTLVFPKREIDLDINLDGKHFDTIKTTGPGFAMGPGGKMTAKFDRPISKDGTYTWQAKTWYYTK